MRRDFAFDKATLDRTVLAARNAGASSATSPAAPPTSIQFNNAGSFGGSANLEWLNGTAQIRLANGAFGTLLSTSAAMGANVPWVLPVAQGAVNSHLTNDGAGNLSWGLIGFTQTNNSALGVGAGISLAGGTNNTALGFIALSANTTGSGNTGLGTGALSTADIASSNTAVGVNALANTTSGGSNTAMGAGTLIANITGTLNVGLGFFALGNNITGNSNVSVGANALSFNTAGSLNVAVGANALLNTDAVGNVGVGNAAGAAITTGTSNVLIGTTADVNSGAATGRIAIGAGSLATLNNGLFFPTTLANVAAGVTVLFDAVTGQMGPMVSSRRFKTNIHAMNRDTARIFDLRPVDFTMKSNGAQDFGYVAEDVYEVLPELVPLDGEGRPFSVHYDRLVVFLLEEVRKLRDLVLRNA